MRLGILGLGKIAEKVVSTTLSKMQDIELYAAASRSMQKAEDFKDKYGFVKAYGTYEDLASDPMVELVYICTPHSEHYENMKLCISHKKNILCEKSFTLDANQAAEVVSLAKDTKVFLAEAMWPRYKEITRKITEVVNSKIVGDIHFLTANLFYPVADKERIMDLKLGGGALLDLGIYPVNFALTHFGYDIDHIEASVIKAETGVDESDVINIFYKNGRMASLSCGIRAISERHAIFYGEKGYIIVDNVNTPSRIDIYNTSDEIIQSYSYPDDITGYEYEFMECVSCIKDNRLETPMMPLSETVKIMEVMDSIRKQWLIQKQGKKLF